MTNKLLAQISNPVLPDFLGGGANPDYNTGTNVIGGIIGAIVGVILILAFIIALFYLLTGALSWITSGGDKGKLENARNKIIHAIMGLIVVFTIWAIMLLVGPFVGLTFPDLPFPTLPSVLENTGFSNPNINNPVLRSPPNQPPVMQ